MLIKTELLKSCISDYINKNISDFEIDADKIADSTAIKALSKIQAVLSNQSIDEIEMIEQIVAIFEHYHLDFGNCHDY